MSEILEFQCDICNEKCRYPSSRMGKTIDCRACGAPFELSKHTIARDDDDDEEEDDELSVWTILRRTIVGCTIFAIIVWLAILPFSVPDRSRAFAGNSNASPQSVRYEAVDPYAHLPPQHRTGGIASSNAPTPTNGATVVVPPGIDPSRLPPEFASNGKIVQPPPSSTSPTGSKSPENLAAPPEKKPAIPTSASLPPSGKTNVKELPVIRELNIESTPEGTILAVRGEKLGAVRKAIVYFVPWWRPQEYKFTASGGLLKTEPIQLLGVDWVGVALISDEGASVAVGEDVTHVTKGERRELLANREIVTWVEDGGTAGITGIGTSFVEKGGTLITPSAQGLFVVARGGRIEGTFEPSILIVSEGVDLRFQSNASSQAIRVPEVRYFHLKSLARAPR